MSDTPYTQGYRAGYEFGSKVEQSFDINLALGLCDQARIAEQQRIIKLLEEHPCFSLETCQQGCLAHDLLMANIALIKGENK